MTAHSDSRPSTAEHRDSQRPQHATSQSSWNPYLSDPDIHSVSGPVPGPVHTADGSEQPASRDAIPPPGAEPQPCVPRPCVTSDGQTAASVPASQTNELLESLSSLTERVKDGMSTEAIVDTVRRFARMMQQKVAKLGGVTSPERSSVPPNDIATSRFSRPARNSLSNSLDGYRPDRDVTAPISVRPNAMELLWVCGDCGQHYPRARECPERCTACGAPKQHFYAPLED